jgi:hypothetical protein
VEVFADSIVQVDVPVAQRTTQFVLQNRCPGSGCLGAGEAHEILVAHHFGVEACRYFLRSATLGLSSSLSTRASPSTPRRRPRASIDWLSRAATGCLSFRKARTTARKKARRVHQAGFFCPRRTPVDCVGSALGRVSAMNMVDSFVTQRETVMTLQLVLQILNVVALVAVPLVVRYLEERVKNAAREATDKALEDYRHEHDRLLAGINADHQRRLHEFSLYAKKQHTLYAELYKRVRIAADYAFVLTGITIGPDFSRFNVERARKFARRFKLDDADIAGAVALYERGEFVKAAQQMDKVHELAKRRSAEKALTRMKNLEAAYELYLSDDVRAKMDLVRARIAEFLVAVDAEREGERGMKSLEKRGLMQGAVAELFAVMRDELRRGEGASQVALARTHAASSLPSLS